MPMSSKGAARRRFAKTGVGVGGVLMTLQSQAACVGVAVSTSGYQSYVNGGCVMNSHITKTQGVAGGRPVSYWDGCSTTMWPTAPTGSGKCYDYSFITLFSPTKTSLYQKTDSYGRRVSMSLLEVLNANISDGGIGKLCVAAYLNTKKGWVTYLPASTIIAIFQGCDSGVGYKPATASTKWSTSMCLTYLAGTMSAT